MRAVAERLRERMVQWRHPLLALLLMLGAAGIRIGLLSQGWPGTDSDDSIMGLMAKHILERGEHPIFFYGQPYMGTIEAHLGAGMFALLGVSEFALKCGLVVLYTLFLGVMYLLLTRLFSLRWALAGLALLACGTTDLLYHELEAYGGYLETILFGALATLLATWLAQTAGQPEWRARRRWLFAAWGCVVGVGIWSDPLVAPFMALTAALLLVTCWREMRGWGGAIATIALLIGISPWIIYIATAPTPQVAKSFLQYTPATKTLAGTPAPTPSLPDRLGRQLLGVVTISVPNTTGGELLCGANVYTAWPPENWQANGVQGCMVARGVWGGGFLALLALALALEAGAFWGVYRKRATGWSGEDRAQLARAGGRLVALAAPGVTILFFALSSAASSAPWQYSRYIIGTLVALPVTCATLWERAPRLAGTHLRGRRIIQVSAIALTGLIGVMLIIGVGATFQVASAARAQDTQQRALATWLQQRGETRLYSDYWICYRMMFQTNEGVICSVLTDQLSLARNRYPPYDAIVQAAPHPVYVFPLHSPQTTAFPDFAAQQGWHVTKTTLFDQYVVFQVAQ